MLTICIPIYNYDSTRLISDLNRQADTLDVQVEIIVINDGSKPGFNGLYDSLSFARVRYISLPENIGRTRVRNLFVTFARYEYLLFLDCDDKIISDDYLKKYLLQMSLGGDVICGGIKYQEKFPGTNKSLHWNYEKKKERELMERRKRFPYEAFISNNFLIRKDVFLAIKFNETLEQYGHEDTLFGFDLCKAGIGIKYIDNPVLHEDLNDNLTFLRKTDLAVQNLVAILNFTTDKGFVRSIALLRVYFSLKSTGILYLLGPFENRIAGICYKKLLAGSAKHICLSLYKLCLFSKYYRSRK
jgi:glycosyltransferase involved in cell wall biosynthesis